MLTGLVNRLRGQVHLRVHCPYPERVLNLCSARNLSFWDLEWEEDACFTCRMTRRDSRIFRQAAEKLDCQTEVLRREGVPYALLHLRRRQTLAVSGVACALLVTLGSFFIWDIQITGCKTVSREEVLRALERSGVRRGAFGLTLDGEDIRNHVLLEIPELSWIAVNVSGCRAHVQVRERRPVPELLDRRVPGQRGGAAGRTGAADSGAGRRRRRCCGEPL